MAPNTATMAVEGSGTTEDAGPIWSVIVSWLACVPNPILFFCAGSLSEC